MGRLADGPRKRRVIVFALAVVVAGCVLSALSNGFPQLVVGRGLQGVGLGLLPVTMAMARSQFSPQKTAHAVATLSVSAAVGAGLGYPITSLIASSTTMCRVLVRRHHGRLSPRSVVLVLPVHSDGRSRRFNYLGMTTLGTAVVGVSVVLSEGETGATSFRPWASCPLSGHGGPLGHL